jgi:hypothetical protein
MNLKQNETHNSTACLFKIWLCNWNNRWENGDFITGIKIMNAHQTEMKYNISVIVLTSAHLCSGVIKYLKQYSTCMELMNSRTNTTEASTDIGLMFTPCIIRRIRNDQLYALICNILYSIYWLLHVSAVDCHHQGASSILLSYVKCNANCSVFHVTQ